MTFTGGTLPGPHAGDMSPLTAALRPKIRLEPAQRAQARRLRKKGWEIVRIAARLGAPVEEVELALTTIRTLNPSPTRKSLNGTVEAHAFVLGEAEHGEAIWQTIDRLFAELAFRRAAAGAPISRPR